MKQDAWVEERLAVSEKQNHDIEKLVKIEHQKITQLHTKIARIREGFEGGLYSLDEAKARVTEFQKAIVEADQGIEHLKDLSGNHNRALNVTELKEELRRLASKKLGQGYLFGKTGYN